ncbi:MAG: hypothetical protein HY319_28805 [Armatimonadetes bacterium]|nr:hypothetical protein [Armatimonadota bacterium]
MRWWQVLAALLVASLLWTVGNRPEQPVMLYVAGQGTLHVDICPWAQRLSAEEVRVIHDRESARRENLQPCPVCRP